MTSGRPRLWVGTLVVVLTTLLWGAVRLWMYGEQQIPLTYVLPMLLTVWTRQRWHLWSMVAAFISFALIKYQWILPPQAHDAGDARLILQFTLFNIVVGGIVVSIVLRLHDVLDERADVLRRQNVELEAQAEELAQQNEEIKAQSEELAQQNEEIEGQSEELQRQNEEIVESNERLEAREEILQAVIDCTGARHDAAGALEQICQRVLSAIGSPADLLAIAEMDGEEMVLRAHAAPRGHERPPARWPKSGSLAGLVLAENRTAYVDDLNSRPDLASPFAQTCGCRSVLASAFHVEGVPTGVVIACSLAPGHWTQDQFRLLEWSAAQCGLIIEGRKGQAALRQRTEAIEAASRAKDEFLATLSHELRTPLTPVIVAIEELVEREQLSAHVREQLEMVRRNVSVQSRLIDDLLDLTRIARGKMDLNQQAVSVETLLRESAAIVAADAVASGQTLTVDLDLPPGCRVIGDAARLHQVFWNLLKNSTKFGARGGIVRMHASIKDGARLCVLVTDDGMGIASKDLERIFQPFEQAATARRRGGSGGLGLGLSIARAITELHDGTISVHSDGPGRGATFTVELPLAPTTQPRADLLIDGQPYIAKAEPGRAGPGRILLVEDHGDTAAVIAHVLRKSGYEVDHVSTVALASERWRAGGFHLLISDLGLPDGTGLDALKAIRACTQGPVRAICMSGYGMESDLENSRQAGFEKHLIKPVSKQGLLAAVQQLMQGPVAGSGMPTGA